MPGSRWMAPGQRPMTGSGIRPVHLSGLLQHSRPATRPGSGAVCGSRSPGRTAGNLVHLSISPRGLAPPVSACTGSYPRDEGSIPTPGLQLDRDGVTEALTLLYRKAKQIDPASMEFLTVDAPQDCIHLLASMEQDGSEDLADARELLASLKGGCSAGTRVANIDAQGNVFPCQFARSPEFLVGNIRDRSVQRALGGHGQPRPRPVPGQAGPVRGQVFRL